MNEKLREKYWNKILPRFLIENILYGNDLDDEEKFIYDSLKHYPINENNIEEIKNESDQKINKFSFSDKQKRLFTDRVFPNITLDTETPILKAGQIWSVHRILPKVCNEEKIEPVAETSYLYLLSTPETYIFTAEDKEVECKVFLFLPISFAIEYATHKDIIINESMIGVDKFMVHCSLESSSFTTVLDKYMGTLSEEIIKKLLNMYYFSQGMEWDEELYFNTEKGSLELDSGRIKLEYQKIQRENFNYLNEQIKFLEMDNESIDKNEIEETYYYSLAADDIGASEDREKFWKFVEKNKEKNVTIFKDEEAEIQINILPYKDKLLLLVYSVNNIIMNDISLKFGENTITPKHSSLETEAGRVFTYFDYKLSAKAEELIIEFTLNKTDYKKIKFIL